MIIGITGKNGSGKDTAAEILKEKGFQILSISDTIREHLKNIKNREELCGFANKEREKHGPDIWAKRTIEKINNKNAAITSIRSPSEIKVLKKLKNFTLIEIEASLETRFNRTKNRNRENSPKTIEEFVKEENKELEGNENEQQLNKTIELADYKIENNETKEQLKTKILALLKKLQNLSS